MHARIRSHAAVFAAALAVTLCGARAGAQDATFAGHWVGLLQAPAGAASIEIDLANDSRGAIAGTIGFPDEDIRGFTLQQVEVAGRSIAFKARLDRPFQGVLAADGKTIDGHFITAMGNVPITLSRTADASIERPAPSPAVAKSFEGTWNGTVAMGSERARVVLTVENLADGTSRARFVNLDEGSLQIPATAIAVTGSTLALELKGIHGSYVATVNQDGSELAGTYKQGELEVPLTVKKAQ